MHMAGKRSQQRIIATYSLPKESRRLFIRDRRTNISFLVDTGSDVSLIPANAYQKRNASQQTLFAANSSSINVYGQKTLTLNLNLRRDFMWTFLIADVKYNLCRSGVVEWRKRFLEGCELLEDDARPGQAHRVITPEMIAEVNAFVLDNRRITVEEIHRLQGNSVGTTHNIMDQHLNFRKICAQWVFPTN
ncbi:retrovirus-related Pol polyprotein from transposon opus [Trichonephila clavata]|uniref:Retrovirus-related Pol polyprotein from transposon opus n=1 Tax=Trichonephila clavata TaxID=2740835 RepID=A0A8X6LMB0_TRICU|nr:retrovirus-related Pol polyprotein from transposon opus [Trichonephila clavata]